MAQIFLKKIMQPFRLQRLSNRVLFVLALMEMLQRTYGLVVPRNCMRRCHRSESDPLRMFNGSYSSFTESSRRKFLWNLVSAVTVTPLLLPEISSAKEPIGDTIWMTGKMPQVPGQKPRDKNDLTGTRKDPSFLRSLADCKNQCENTASTGGYSKTKDECLSECQDICCTTYQQCTFAIVQRI